MDEGLKHFDIGSLTKEDERVYGDVYDLYAEVINIHSEVKEINADFSISNLTEVEIKFVRDQLKLIIIVVEFLKDKETQLRASRLLLRDIFSLVIMSRARDGKVLNAVLTYGRSKEESEELHRAGIMQRLFGGKNDKR